jgi:hypothetical protein
VLLAVILMSRGGGSSPQRARQGGAAARTTGRTTANRINGDDRPAAGLKRPGSTSTTALPAAASAPPPTTTGGRSILLDIRRDTGPKSTPHFVTSQSHWTLGWAYDCTAQGGTGSFKVTILNADGSPSSDGGVDQQGSKGSSVAAYTSTGERYLSVQTTCVWAIRVTS